MPNRFGIVRNIRIQAGGISRHRVARAIAVTGIFGVVIGGLLSAMPAPDVNAAVGINKQVNFQGKVVNSDGTNVTDGSYNFVFRLYTVASGGSNIWSESKSLTVTDGIFQTSLGSVTSLPGSVDFNTDNIYLGINFNSDGEMSPRIQFTAVPYAFNTDTLDGIDSAGFAQLNPSSAQSGSLNVTGSVQAATSLQAPLVDTATAVALGIGTGTATSVTIGRTTTPFLVQGNAASTFTATNGSFKTTVGFTTPTANNAINFPDAGGTICTTVATTCSATYQASGAYIAKNASDTSSFAVTASNYLYGFTNASSAVASGVLQLNNGSNTGNALLVTASGNPASGSALILANNTNGTPSGNLIDLQKAGVSSFAVDFNGNVTQAGGSSTTDTINGQRISSAANFTGTVTAATSLLAPLVDTASAGVLGVGTATATAITLGRAGITTTNAGALTVTQGFTANSTALFQNATNTTSALRVLNQDGTQTVLNADTSNGRISVGSTAAQARLEVVGDIISKGTEWTIRTSVANNSWSGLAYGNGLFVATSIDGTNRVMTSPDGVNWTSRASQTGGWRDVTYGNGLFVAVSDVNAGNRVMTSPDGITWTLRAVPVDNNWRAVTYGSGTFVAVAYSGSGNRVMTSPDGITWTARTSVADSNWRSIVYGNGLFVTVAEFGSNGTRVMTSPDGITWSLRNTPTPASDIEWGGVTYGNGLFVAVAASGTGNRVMTSPDGISWTARASATDNTWQSVAYGNGTFVAISNNGTGNRVMTSQDGINWVTRSSAADNNWLHVAYGDGIFVAVSTTGTGTRAMTSGRTNTTPFSANNIFQGGLDVRSGTINLSVNSAANTNINTGTSTGAVSVGNAAAGTLTLQGNASTTLVANSGANSTTLNFTTPTAARTITLQDNSGIIPLSTAGNTLFFTTTGATALTLPTSGTLAVNPASGAYLQQVPTTTAANIVTPIDNSVVGLTVNGTTGTSARAAMFNQSGNSDTVHVTSTNTGVQAVALAVSRNNGSGSTTSLLQLQNSAGSVTNGINIAGTYTNLINSTNFRVTNAGAVIAVGVDSGTGLIQGTGGATISGAAASINDTSNFATNINTGTSTGTVNIGNSAAGAIAIQGATTVGLTGTTVNINAPTIATNQTTAALLNTTATTVNAFGAASTLNLGAASGTATIANPTLVLGSGAAGALQSSTNQNLNIASNGTGILNLTSGSGTIVLGSSTVQRASTSLVLDATNASNSTISITNSGAGVGNLVVEGDITSNSGTFASAATTANLLNTTATTINLGGAASALTVGATTGTLTVRNANQVFGNAAGSGQFTNNGSTLNSTLAVANDADGGALGGGLAASASVDIYTSININQTTAGQTITLASPTSTTAGRIMYVSNISSNSTSFVMYGSTILAGGSASFVWNGTAWSVNGTAGAIGSVGTINSQTKSANGAVILGTSIYLQTAEAIYPGLVSTGDQAFAGVKTFNSNGFFAEGLTVGGTSALGGDGRFNVRWKSGDTAPTSTLGSTNASNNQIAVKADSYSAPAVAGTSVTNSGVEGNSTSGTGVSANSSSSYGLYARSASSNSALFQSSNQSNGAPTLVSRQQGTSTADLLAAQDLNGNNLLYVAYDGRLFVGRPSNQGGNIAFYNATNANTVTVTSAVATANRTLTLPDESGTICVQTSTACGFLSSTTGVALQASYPGTAQTGNFNVTGTGSASTLLGNTLDTLAANALEVGTTNATQINLRKNTVFTGNAQVGVSTGTGGLTNNGSTVNTSYPMANLATGGWDAGGAAATVDRYTYITANQTTASQTLTLPTPTASTTYGRMLYLTNGGTASFTILGTTLSAGSTATLVWSLVNAVGTWTFAGADGSGILNQNGSDQTANFRISGTGRANTSFTAPAFDSNAAGTLSVGAANATTIQLGSNGASNPIINLDSGTSAINIGTGAQARTISLGTGGAVQGITIGSTTAGSSTLIQGPSVTVGTAGASLFKNNGATDFATCDYTGVTGAVTLNASTRTPDVCTAFRLTTTGAATITVPVPAAGPGSLVYISNMNASSNAITLLGSNVGIGSTATLVYNGTDWTYAGADASGLQTSYNNSAGAAPSIAMNTTNRALTLQASATSGIAAGNELFGVRSAAGNDTTLGNSILTVSTYGLGINVGTAVQNPVTTSTYDLQFGGTANRTIAVINQATAATAGANLTVAAAAGNTSGVGGTLALVAGAGGNAAAGGAASLTGGAAGGGNTAGGAATVRGGVSSGTGVGGAVLVIGGAGSTTAGSTGGGVTIQGGAAGAVAGGLAGGVAVVGAAGSSTGTGSAGATISLTAGNAGGSGNNNGGNISLTPGTATGTGIPGVVSIDTPVFTATTRGFTQTANNQSFAIPVGDIDTNSTVVTTLTGAFTGGTVSVPAPTNTTTGRIVYITNGSATIAFTLTPLGSSAITMNINSTATLVWNNTTSTWTAAGADASTSLQQVYNNTSTSPASIVTTSTAKNVQFQAGVGFDSANIIQVTNSFGANALTVDTRNTASSLNLAQNGGGETGGTPPTGWSAHGGAGNPTQTTTVGNFASGTAGISQATTAATHGVRNVLNATTLANTTTYVVSFSVKVSVAMTNANMIVEYYRNNTPTLDATCSTFTATTNPTLSTAGFIKYTCSFTTSATAKATTNFLAIRQADATARTIFVDNLALVAQNATGAQNSGALRVGGFSGQGLTLLTVDSFAAAPFATGATINADLLGSLYYDTTIGKLQCYEAKGWGSCGNSPNNSAFLIPEYPNAVLGAASGVSPGIGTMTASVCSGTGRLNINTSLCASTEDYNYYSWTSPQATFQTYSIYVRYQLPATYNGFFDANTVKLVGRTTSTTDGSVSYRLFSSAGSTACGTTAGFGSTDVTTLGGANAWTTRLLAADETSGPGAADCTFAANDIITFRIDLVARNNATVYAANLTFTTKGL